jgi:hypothetical protein
VIYQPARALVRDGQVLDSLVFEARPRIADPRRVVGSKPGTFAGWIFGLMQAQPGDVLEDLYPGSRRVGQAFEHWTESAGRDGGVEAGEKLRNEG